MNKGGKGQRKGCRKNQRRGERREQRSGKQILNDPYERKGFPLLLQSLMAAAKNQGGMENKHSLHQRRELPGQWAGGKGLDIQASLLLSLTWPSSPIASPATSPCSWQEGYTPPQMWDLSVFPTGLLGLLSRRSDIWVLRDLRDSLK